MIGQKVPPHGYTQQSLISCSDARCNKQKNLTSKMHGRRRGLPGHRAPGTQGRLPTSSNNRHRETHAVCFEQSVSKHAHFHRHANLPLSYTKLTDPRLELDLPGRKQPSLQSCLTTIRLTRWIKFLLCKIKAWATKLNQAIHSSLLPQAALKSTVATTMEAHRGGSGNTTTSPIWRPHSSYIYIYVLMKSCKLADDMVNTRPQRLVPLSHSLRPSLRPSSSLISIAFETRSPDLETHF